jgi:cytidyltransferase-like protein
MVDLYANVPNPEEAGFFKTKAPFLQLGAHQTPSYGIDSSTQVIFYPGSFGTFHEGHVSVVKRARELYPESFIVVSPANADYASEKYGVWSEFASNYHRYKVLKEAVKTNLIDAIDIDSMLNFTCDHNFTDLLSFFLESQGLSIETMKKPPIILAGKDRHDFTKLNNYTNLVKVVHLDDVTGASTSALVPKMRSKKSLILRCSTKREFDFFAGHFLDQYEKISPLYLEDELYVARQVAERVNATHTNCREYSSFLTYVKVSRKFINPLEDATFSASLSEDVDGKVFLDSDSYSGATRTFMESQGAIFHVVQDLSGTTQNVELLDFSDFKKPNFMYPYVDISSRCSMQAFDTDFHNRFNTFKLDLLKEIP